MKIRNYNPITLIQPKPRFIPSDNCQLTRTHTHTTPTLTINQIAPPTSAIFEFSPPEGREIDIVVLL